MPFAMKRSLFLLAALCACEGPPAPDAAVCQDFIHRICLQPICPDTQNALSPGSDCEGALLARTGCGSDAFAFSGNISRDRFLSCRLPLLRAGGGPDTHPSCDDVLDVVNTCPDVIAFMNGGGP